MRGRKFFTMVGLLTIAALVLAACQPATVEVTRVVTQEKEVEVTRIVAGTPVVEVVTATPAPVEEAEVTYPRNETLYTSGKQWGPPTSWNPLQPGSYAMGVIGLCYETLFLYDPLKNEYTTVTEVAR